MPTCKSFIKASGSYAVITLYSNDFKVNELRRFLEKNGWKWNGNEQPWKPRGWLNSYYMLEWAKEFCQDPIRFMKKKEKEEQEKKRKKELEIISRCGGYWRDLSEEELKSRIDGFVKKLDDYEDFCYAERYLNLSDHSEKEIKFMGVLFDDFGGITLRFWTSYNSTWYTMKPVFLKCGDRRIRLNNNKYFQHTKSKDSSGTFYDYTRDRIGHTEDIVLSLETKVSIRPIDTIEIVLGVFKSDNWVYNSEKMILSINTYEEDFSVTVTTANEFIEETMNGSFGDINDFGNNSNSDNYYESGELAEFSSWEVESILKRMGYTVSKKEDLSAIERQKILEKVIRSKKMTKSAVCHHIENQITLRKYNSKYSLAISKWREDLDYIRKNL